jgi:hypothetical protein
MAAFLSAPVPLVTMVMVCGAGSCAGASAEANNIAAKMTVVARKKIGLFMVMVFHSPELFDVGFHRPLSSPTLPVGPGLLVGLGFFMLGLFSSVKPLLPEFSVVLVPECLSSIG